MTKPKGHQLMFSVNMFANTIVVDPMQVGLENQLHIFSELVRLVGELVDLEPPEEVPENELDVFKKTLVLQSLLDAINKQAKNGQDALNNAEANFVDLAKANPQLQGMVNDYIGYYDSPKKLFEQMDNADEVTQVKRLASLIF
jgi:hypothetical protein